MTTKTLGRTQMTSNKIRWHLARDNQTALHKFCRMNTMSPTEVEHYEVDGVKCFTNTYRFNNGGYIKAEMLVGTADRSYTVADHFQVVDWSGGTA